MSAEPGGGSRVSEDDSQPRPGTRNRDHRPRTPGLHIKPLRRIHIGDLCVSRKPVVVQTLLGSCVSVCLFDPVQRIGGMNHIFLPGDPDLQRYDSSARFGINAMELLINAIMNLGGRRARLAAKVFGGAQLLPNIPQVHSTGTKNIAFVDAFLERESIPVLARDVGGTDTRILRFHTDTGAALLRRVPSANRHRVVASEARYGRRVGAALDRDTDVTWFR